MIFNFNIILYNFLFTLVQKISRASVVFSWVVLFTNFVNFQVLPYYVIATLYSGVGKTKTFIL